MVGLILTTFNFKEATARCLTSLLAVTARDTRLLVVDNNSTDGTATLLASFGCEVLFNREEISLARALNQGLSRLLRDREIRYIGWIHNDMLFYPGWLEGLMETLDSHPRLGKLAPYNFTGTPPPEAAVVAEFTSRHRGHLEPGNACPWLMPRLAVARVGLFDEDFLHCGGYEDWDYNNRLLNAGYKVMITRGSAVWHETMGTRKHTNQDQWSRHNAEVYHRKWGQWTPRV